MLQHIPQTSSPASQASFTNIEELYTRYGRQAFGLAIKVLDNTQDAEEAVQEVFLRYWRNPGLYTPSKGPFLNWLLREIHCYCLDHLPVKGDFSVNLTGTSGPLSTETIIKTAVDSAQEISRQRQAQQALAGLPQAQRAIVELAYFKGLNHQQIAQVTGQPAQSVRQNLATGLLLLKRGMAQLNPSNSFSN